MKLLFLLLVLVNLALFAWHSGAFGTLPEAGREPARLTNQIAPERIRVLTPDEVKKLREQARERGCPRARWRSPAGPWCTCRPSRPGPRRSALRAS